MAAQALIFDLDGTLVDSTSVIAGLWRQWAARHGVDSNAVLAASPGRRAIETVEMFAPRGVDAEAEAAALVRAATEKSEGLVPTAGATALLWSLPQDRWAIVTSAERKLAEKWLHHTGLPLPDILIAAQDVSCGKPDPSGYLQATERLGFSPADTVVFEDAPSGLAAGHAAGSRVIAIGSSLTAVDLEKHDWLPDFSEVTFCTDRYPTLKVGSRRSSVRLS